MRREYPDRPIVAVGAAVCWGERVLVVQRAREPSFGVWTVPGGMVDLGERLQEAAVREVREECGIEIEAGPVVEVIDNIVRDDEGRVRFHYTIVDLAARYVGGDLAPNDELMDAAWITPEQFEAYGVRPKAQAVLRKALSLAGDRLLPPDPARKAL